MTTATQNRIQGRNRISGLFPALAGALMALTLTTQTVQAQQALGAPFVGKHQLSFYVTELSRDGIDTDRAAVFGGVYGHRFNNQDAPLQFSMLVRAAARALQGTEDGILDAGLTLAATRPVRSLGALTVTGAAGLDAVAWGQEAPAAGEPETGRAIVRAPLSAGMAYDIRIGAATIAPFVSVIGAWSNERDYVGGQRAASDSGWRLGRSSGVSLRFKETVLSVREISRERGLPNTSRVVFTAGMSW